MHQPTKPTLKTQLRKLLFFSAVLSFIPLAQARSSSLSYDFKVETEITKSMIQLSYQMSQLKTDSESLSSSGLLFGYSYDFTKDFSLQTQFILSMQQSGASTMTGFGFFGVYNLFRTNNQKSLNVKIDNKRLLTLDNNLGSYLELGAGAQQFYFNGGRGVYSVSGPSFRAAYNMNLFGLNTAIGAQSSSVKIAEKATQLTTFILGLTFPL